MKLALALGYANPDAMLAEMQPHHLGEWLALYKIDPWGEFRADLRMGIQAAVVANVNRDSKRKPDAYTPADFMPDFAPQKESLLGKAKAVFAALPATRKKKG